MSYTEENKKRLFNAYENIRILGKFNMFSNEARLSTGLNKEQYVYVMEHYSELKNKFGGK